MDENYLITGYHGVPHVTAENDRGINAAIFGPGRFVLPTGQQFRAEYIGNNTIRLYDGKLMDNGAAAGIPAGRYIDLLIPEAGQGKKRNDLIVFQYSKDSTTLVESGSFVVIHGIEADGTAEDPALSQADLLTDAAAFDQMALWRIPVSATVISDPVQLFDVSYNIQNVGDPARYVIQAESSDGVQYSATLDGVESIFPGLTITIILNKASATTAPKLNVNGWGAKTIRRRVSGYTALTIAGSSDDWLVANKPLSVTYNGTFWLLDDVRPNANDLYGSVPVSSGGHGGNTAEEARANLGAISMHLLWENPNQTSPFGETSINPGLSNYDAYIVIARYSTSVFPTVSAFSKTGYSTRLTANGRENIVEHLDRPVVVKASTGQIDFMNATRDGVVDNNYLIPLFVYGIKGILPM